MVFVMKHIINYVFYALTVIFLFALVMSMNSPPSLWLVSQNTVYATPEQQEDSSTENNDGSSDANDGSETTQEKADSEESEDSIDEENNSNDDGSESPSSDQSNTCPETNYFANVPTYIGQDGCQYPCPSPDSNDQSNIPQGCPIGPTSQSSTGLSNNEGNTLQPPQDNKQPEIATVITGDNTMISPTTSSSNGIPSTRSNGDGNPAIKSFDSADTLKPGSGQVESSIPLRSSDTFKSFDPADTLKPGSGQVESRDSNVAKEEQIDSGNNAISQGPLKPGSGQVESSIPLRSSDTFKSFDPADTLKPGSGQLESSIPLRSNDPAKPFTPGAGNPQVEGISKLSNTNPQTPLNPGNIPTNIPDKGYVTVITKVLGFFNGIQAINFEVCVDSTVTTDGKEHKVNASPPCANGSGLGFKYIVQAPGNIGIAVKNLLPVSYIVEHPLSMDISAYESKTITIYITPYPSQ